MVQPGAPQAQSSDYKQVADLRVRAELCRLLLSPALLRVVHLQQTRR